MWLLRWPAAATRALLRRQSVEIQNVGFRLLKVGPQIFCRGFKDSIRETPWSGKVPMSTNGTNSTDVEMGAVTATAYPMNSGPVPMAQPTAAEKAEESEAGEETGDEGSQASKEVHDRRG